MPRIDPLKQVTNAMDLSQTICTLNLDFTVILGRTVEALTYVAVIECPELLCDGIEQITLHKQQK